MIWCYLIEKPLFNLLTLGPSFFQSHSSLYAFFFVEDDAVSIIDNRHPALIYIKTVATSLT